MKLIRLRYGTTIIILADRNEQQSAYLLTFVVLSIILATVLQTSIIPASTNPLEPYGIRT